MASKVRKLIISPRQTIEYYALYAIESGFRTVELMVLRLKSKGLEFTKSQISGSLQRLRQQGIVKRTSSGRWVRLYRNG